MPSTFAYVEKNETFCGFRCVEANKNIYYWDNRFGVVDIKIRIDDTRLAMVTVPFAAGTQRKHTYDNEIR